MLSLGAGTPIYLYTLPADMRKGFDGLMGLITSASMGDVYDGLFVFGNRRGDRMKILYFDRDGLAIWYKRLERGRFQWPVNRGLEGDVASIPIEASELRLILDGIDLNSVKRRRRWRPPESSVASSRRGHPNPRDPVENQLKLDKTPSGAKVWENRHDPAPPRKSRRRPAGD